MIEDQMNLPEESRPFPSPRHPNARKELWQSQERLQELEEMRDPNWVPLGTKYNIYNREGFKNESMEMKEY